MNADEARIIWDLYVNQDPAEFITLSKIADYLDACRVIDEYVEAIPQIFDGPDQFENYTRAEVERAMHMVIDPLAYQTP